MQKIETIYLRDPNNLKLVTPDVNPACQWLFNDDLAIPTEKFDGTCCLIRDGRLYRRHVIKVGKALPPGWLHWTFDPSQQSGHGWAPVSDSTADQYHREAFRASMHDGTYELVGPKIQRNPYGLTEHELWRHGDAEFPYVPKDFDGMRDWLTVHVMEGLVWHHPDGRMAKIKRRDFGLPWPDRED